MRWLLDIFLRECPVNGNLEVVKYLIEERHASVKLVLNWDGFLIFPDKVKTPLKNASDSSWAKGEFSWNMWRAFSDIKNKEQRKKLFEKNALACRNFLDDLKREEK